MTAPTIRTVFHAYHFDLTTAAGRKAYAALCAAREAEGREVFATLKMPGESYYKPEIDGAAVELETAHVFDNQWNTAPIAGVSASGLRVFDWAEDVVYVNGRRSDSVRAGHWLELTDDMVRVRRDTLKCGYCGAHYQASEAPADGFCSKCTGSEYLKESELRLTRLLPAGAKFNTDRAPLTDAEAAALLPVYREAQLTGRNTRDAEATKAALARIEKRRADTIATAERKKANADTVRDIELWVLDNLGYRWLGNVIFYDHTGRACFGWNKPLSDEDLSTLLDKVSEFAWPYDIKTADGRTLSGER
jgi:hypothetical protein